MKKLRDATATELVLMLQIRELEEVMLQIRDSKENGFSIQFCIGAAQNALSLIAERKGI